MIQSDLLHNVHALPRPVRDVIGDASSCGCSSSVKGQPTYAWVLHKQSLLVWKAEDGPAATVRRLTLPQAPSGAAFVEVVPHKQSSALSVIVCTGAGWLYVWLDATFSGDPFSQQLATGSEGVICALAATAAEAAAGPGFLAVVATSDAALHMYHGSSSGIFPRQFYNPGSSSSTQGGLLHLIGTAVDAAKKAQKLAVDMQWVSGIPFLRTSPSTAAATQMQLVQLDSSRWRLYVLSGDALDCWLLGTLSGKQSSEQLLWSLSVQQAVLGRHRAVDCKVLGFSASLAPAQQQQQQGNVQDGAAVGPSQEVIYVCSAHMAESAVRYQYACSMFAVEGGPNKGPRLMLKQPLSTEAPLPSPKSHSRPWQLVAHAQQPSCLLLSPNGVLLEWLRTQSGLPQMLSNSSSSLAIACTGLGSNWQLLDGEYGLLELRPLGAPAAAGGAAAAATPVDKARTLIIRLVQMMQQQVAEGCPCKGLAAGLADSLSELGVLDSPDGWNMLKAVSSSMVDSLPKTGTAGPASLATLLSDKQQRHRLLLAALQYGNVLQQLPPGVLAVLFEHAQMLAAAACVLQYQVDKEGAAAADAGNNVDKLQSQASKRAIETAGSLAATGAGEAAAAAAEQLHEAFFGRPTISLPALFKAAAAHAANIRHEARRAGDAAGSAVPLLQQLLGLCGLLVAAVDGAESCRQDLRAEVFNQVSKADTAGPGWLAKEGPRAAWRVLSEACLLVLPLLTELPQRQQLAHQAHLPALAQLLTALRTTLAAAADPTPDMVAAYRDLPWQHGQQLLHVAQEELPVLRSKGLLELSAKGVARAEYASEADSVLLLLPGLRDTLVWQLQQLAQQHRCWELLYATCEVLQHVDPVLEGQLQQQMRLECAASGPTLPAEGFTRYVMNRWHSERRVLDLLQLAKEDFTSQLQAYLADTPQQLWMSHVQAQQYAAAASSLDKAASAATTTADAGRLWCLTKLAVKAAGARAPGSQQLMAAASARVLQLQLQAQLVPQRGGDPPMLAEELAATALRAAAVPAGLQDGVVAGVAVGLRGADAAVAAVEVLALDAGKHKADSYGALWRASWLAVLKSTQLQELLAERSAVGQAGWSGDAYQAAVRASPVFRALLAAGNALQLAAAVSPDINPRTALDEMVAGLQGEVADARQQEVLAEVVGAAKEAMGY